MTCCATSSRSRLLARSNFVLATRAGLPVNTVQELIALAKASPGKLTMASYGIGSTSHVTMASFEDATKTSFLHVPYRGVGPAVNALLTGEVDTAFVTPHIVVGLQKAGNVKILGAASLQRMPNRAGRADVHRTRRQRLRRRQLVRHRGAARDSRRREGKAGERIAEDRRLRRHSWRTPSRSASTPTIVMRRVLRSSLRRKMNDGETLIKARKIEIP